MHIVLANQWYPPESGWGGVGTYNYVMAHALTGLGHEVSVITSRLSAEVAQLQARDAIQIERILVRDAYYLRRLPVAGRHVRILQQLRYSRQVEQALRRLHRRQPIDVVEFAEVNAEGFFYARRPDAPVVVRCHTPTAVLARYHTPAEMPFATRLTAWCERAAARRAHALTAPSQDTARVAANLFQLALSRICPIPNPVDLPGFVNSDAPAGDSTVTLLHVGRLDRVKGVEVLVDAFASVAAQLPQARIVFAGPDRRSADGGSQRARLEARLSNAGLRDKAEFLGAISQAALQDWYRRADICVVPSLLYESFSYTCAQAMAAGRAVVASRIGGIPETVTDGETGLLVEPGDTAALADAIVRLASDPALCAQMGSAGRAKALSEYSPLQVASRILAVYIRAKDAFVGGV